MDVKRLICLMLAALMCGMPTLAAPQLTDELRQAAGTALSYLASGEYERLVTLLPFSGIAPGAAEWERFARNYESIEQTGRDAVAYWKNGSWVIAVPTKDPKADDAEALMLLSEDGKSFTGYRYATWTQVAREFADSDGVALETP